MLASLVVVLTVVSCLTPFVHATDTTVAADGSIAATSNSTIPCISRETALKVSASPLYASDILSRHAFFCNETKFGDAPPNFLGETLAYVTPWNGHGYDVAKFASSKFTFISPVWLQARLEKQATVVITGTHDIDQGWMKDVRAVCERTQGRSCPRIVPRVAWEIPQQQSGSSSSSKNEKLTADAVKAILAVVSTYGFDGIVLEGPSSTPSFKYTLQEAGYALHAATNTFNASRPLMLILVLSPPAFNKEGKLVGGTSPSDFQALAGPQQRRPGGTTSELSSSSSSSSSSPSSLPPPIIDRFSLMTYDYSVHRGDGNGPNAPLPWMRSTVDALIGDQRHLASKILVGQPFYGYDFNDAITYGRYLDLLREREKKSKSPFKLRWEANTQEHAFSYIDPRTKAKRTVHYPSLASVAARIQLAEEMKCGISIWEIGQGLDYWLDLF